MEVLSAAFGCQGATGLRAANYCGMIEKRFNVLVASSTK